MTQTEMDYLAPLMISSAMTPDGVRYYFAKKDSIGGVISLGTGYKVLGTGCRAMERKLKELGWNLDTSSRPYLYKPPLPF